MKLLLLENHRLPIVVASAAVNKVRLYEPADKVGVAALLGDLLGEGTATRTGEEISRLIEDVGGTLAFNSSGGSLKVLSPDADLGFDLFFDSLSPRSRRPSRSRPSATNSSRPSRTRSRSRTRRPARRSAALVYGKHPYGRPTHGTVPVVKKLALADALAFHKKVFVPNNVVVAVVGDFDSDKLIAGIKKRTADLQKAELPKLDVAAPPKATKFAEAITSDAAAAQVHFYAGHVGIRRDNPDYYKLLVMDYVLGTGPGFTDRLSASLRDRQGLAYTVGRTSPTGPARSRACSLPTSARSPRRS